MAATLTQDEETALISAALTGSDDAFAAIYTAFEAGARRAIFSMVAEDQVDDVIQETFIRVYKSLKTFQGGSRLATWIHRIAVNAALETLRKARINRKDRMTSIDETFESEDGEALPGLELGYEDRNLESSAERDLVRAGLAKLKRRDRSTLLLILEGYGPTEIAKLRNISEPAAKGSMWRAKHHLKEAIEALQRPCYRRTHRNGDAKAVTFHVLTDPKEIDKHMEAMLNTKVLSFETETTTEEPVCSAA